MSDCLISCAAQGPANVDAIGLLVELGAKVDAVIEAKSLETPLHIAARAGRLDVVAKLLRCGVPVTARTKVRGAHLIVAAGLSFMQSWSSSWTAWQ